MRFKVWYRKSKQNVVGAGWVALAAVLFAAVLFSDSALARPYYYPGVRYQNLAGSAMGGITLPLSDEVGNALFNNPAALARNTKFKAEYLNLNLEANSNLLGGLGLETLKATGLSGMVTTLNGNQNRAYGAGFTNVTAFQWGGFGLGLLYQRYGIASSNGTEIQYNALSQFVPAAGYAVALARGVVRLGYSVQWVNQAYGSAATPNTNTSAAFLSGLSEGRGLSHQASVNFVFPFTYVPTFSILARNIGGTHFVGGSLFTGAQSSAGITPDEPMSVDLAFNYMVRFSGKVKSHFYFQYRDATSAYNIPVLERMSLGAEVGISEAFLLRGGANALALSAGFAYKSKSSEIGITWFNEANPLSNTGYWDTRFGLQYKFFFQAENSREKGSPNN